MWTRSGLALPCWKIPMTEATPLSEFTPPFRSSFVPISTDIEGMGLVSRLEVREQQIKQCVKEVDANPTSVDAWMNYVQLYGLFAEEAETKKERVS